MAKLSGAYARGTQLTLVLSSGAGPDSHAHRLRLYSPAYAISVRTYVWLKNLRLPDAMPQRLSQAPLKSACVRLDLWHLLAKGPS